MLDVHPPHAPTHTWRDFLIHIGTIAIGLLIAVGLEQSVEYLHHRHQIKETRAALQAEFEENLLDFRADLAHYRYDHDGLANDLAVLLYVKLYPGTPESSLPGTLVWSTREEQFDVAAWKVAQQDGVAALLPQDEITRSESDYTDFTFSQDTQTAYWVAVNQARHFMYVDSDPSHLSPAELNHEIELIEQCIDANYRWGITLENLAEDDPRFSPAPSHDDIDRAAGLMRSESDQQKLVRAQQLTNARIANAAAAVRQTQDAVANHQPAKP